MEAQPAKKPVEELLAHAEWVQRLAKRLVLDEDRAADVVQQTWVKALEKGPREGVPATRWLGQVAANFAKRSHRSQVRQQRRERLAARPDAQPSAADVVARAEAHRQVVEAVMSLPEPYRQVVLLRYFEDRTPREIALEMGMNDATLRSQLKRGIELLRKRMAAQHGTQWKASCLLLIGWSELGQWTPATLTMGTSLGIAGSWIMATKLKIGIAAGLLLGVGAIWHLSDTPAAPDEYEVSERQETSRSDEPIATARALTRSEEQRQEIPAAQSADKTELEKILSVDPSRLDFSSFASRSTFHGRVVFPNGRPIPPGTTVSIEDGGGFIQMAEGEEIEVDLTTGEFRIEASQLVVDGVDMGLNGKETDLLQGLLGDYEKQEKVTLVAGTPDGVQGILEEVPFEDGMTQTGLVIVMESVPYFTGQVIDGRSGRKPVADASLTFSLCTDPISEESWTGLQAYSDARGVFSMAIPQAMYPRALQCQTAGFAEWNMPTEHLSDISPMAHIEVVLNQGATLRGVVVDRNGLPPRGSRLVAWFPKGKNEFVENMSVYAHQTWTDEQGHFELENLPPGPCQVGVWRDNGAMGDLGQTQEITAGLGSEEQFFFFAVNSMTGHMENYDALTNLHLNEGEVKEIELRLKELWHIKGQLIIPERIVEKGMSWRVHFVSKNGQRLGTGSADAEGYFSIQTESQEPGYLVAVGEPSSFSGVVSVIDQALSRDAIALNQAYMQFDDIGSGFVDSRILPISPSGSEEGSSVDYYRTNFSPQGTVQVFSQRGANLDLPGKSLAETAVLSAQEELNSAQGYEVLQNIPLISFLDADSLMDDAETIGYAVSEYEVTAPFEGVSIPVHDTELVVQQSSNPDYPIPAKTFFALPESLKKESPWNFLFPAGGVKLRANQSHKVYGLPPETYEFYLTLPNGTLAKDFFHLGIGGTTDWLLEKLILKAQ